MAPRDQAVGVAVQALLARCDLVTRDDYRAKLEAMAFPPHRIDQELVDSEERASFTIKAAVQLEDGSEIPWRDDDDRGFSVSGIGFGIEGQDVWSLLSREHLAQSVRNGVVDSTVAGLRREWLELAALLRGHGVEVLPEELAAMPLQVEFSDRLKSRLGRQDPKSDADQ